MNKIKFLPVVVEVSDNITNHGYDAYMEDKHLFTVVQARTRCPKNEVLKGDWVIDFHWPYSMFVRIDDSASMADEKAKIGAMARLFWHRL